MKISRRSVLAASASAPLILGTSPAKAATASIQLHTHRHRGEIDKKIVAKAIKDLDVNPEKLFPELLSA